MADLSRRLLGRRCSTIKQITTANVKGLTLAWVYRINTSRAGAIVGGEGPETPPAGSAPQIKSTPLMINGTLYFSVPDHVYAVDARTGRDVWHFAWKTRGGDHIGNRGVGILDNWLYFLTPDNYFVSLDVATGKERWHHEIPGTYDPELNLYYPTRPARPTGRRRASIRTPAFCTSARGRPSASCI